MSNKSIIIIGAGMGGLAAGIYGRINGYQTTIFEMHTLPGGQCTAWNRKGYTFDACIHHLFGCDPGTKIYSLWHELGAMPRELIRTQECVSILSPEGKIFHDYYDLQKLEQHLNELSPADAKITKEYIAAIRLFSKSDLWGDTMIGTTADIVKSLPLILSGFKWFKPTMQQFAERFSDPFLRKAFALLVYSIPIVPFFIHVARHAYGYRGDIQWPAGGALEFARSIEKKYRDLGGQVHYNSRVERIVVENDRAVGIKLADGSEHRADIVISNADGRKTIMSMLEGKYTNKHLDAYCKEPADETYMALQVFLGVHRDLSKEPSALIMLLDKPVNIAGHEHNSIEMQIYGFDPSLAQPGKGVIKMELSSLYSYWKNLYADPQRYAAEKQKVAEQVIEIVSGYLKGIKEQIEVIDVSTIMTWERYMGGTHGFANAPIKKVGVLSSIFGQSQETTIHGLSDFYFVGQWATSTGALFANALSGRKAIQAICRKDRKKFMSASM